MGKVIIYRSIDKDTYFVSKATIAATWMPGQLFCFNTTGEFAQLASGNNALGVGQCDDLEISAPPTGSVVTVLSGQGTRFDVDHTIEVLAGTAARCYNIVSPASSPQSGSINADLYCDGLGQFSLTPVQPAESGSSTVVGKLVKIPSSSNNYTIGVILRI